MGPYVTPTSKGEGGGSGREAPLCSTRVIREVWTARKAQRPTAWISFEEVRETVLGWPGYKILALRRRDL